MSFPAYSGYKHSGIELLGEFPDHWTLKRFKNVFVERAERSTDGSEELLSVSAYFGIKPRSETLDEGDHLSRAESLEGYKVCQAGDLVINIMLAWNRGLGFSWQRGIVSPAYCVFYVTDGSVPEFLDYLVRSDECVRYFKTHSAGIMDSRLRLYPESFGRLFTAIPPACEQTQIARFLDYETARIDALIDEQQRLIKLLKEKRQTVISNAVTKGLDPTVPMKDSGVEWLGEVPAHWSSIQIGRVCRKVSDGPHFSPNYVDDGVMFLSARNIAVDGWHLDDAKFVSEEDYLEFCRRIVPEKGDVLYTKGGTTGIARVVDLDERFQVWVHVAVLKLDREQVDPHYMAFSLNSTGCYEQSQLHTRGATNQDLGLTRMIKIWFALPPREEQIRICEFLSLALSKIDDLIAEAATVTGLLGERRSALISAAVTGKIDVRGWQPPAGALTPELAQETV